MYVQRQIQVKTYSIDMIFIPMKVNRFLEQQTTVFIRKNEPIQRKSLPPSTSTGFNIFQSIKDVTQLELARANPLGLLGKEVISVTGTTHCPEPIPPKGSGETIVNNLPRSSTSSATTPSKLSPINENSPQQIHFPLNNEEKLEMQRRRSITLLSLTDPVLPPCPGEFITDNNQPHLFTQPNPTTLVADFIPDTMTINVFEVFIYAWGVIAFFFDMIADLVLAHAYYQEGAYWLFILTLMCVVLPNLTLSVFSLVWYMDSSQLKASTNETSSEYSSCQKQNNSCQTNSNEHMEIDDSSNQSVNQKNFQFPATTINVLTWIIRIIILVLQLDLCLK